MKIGVFVFLLSCNFVTSIIAQTVLVEITDVRSFNGHLLLGIYTNDIDYQNRSAVLKKTVLKTKLKNGKVTTTIEGLGPGVYGIALLDDEDFDRKMKYKYLFPKEGFAFSNYFHVGYSKPHFKEFSFVLGKEDKKVTMKCKYM